MDVYSFNACVHVFVCVCVRVQVKKGGGMSINSTLTLTNMSEKLVSLILHEYSILVCVCVERGVW